MRKIVFSIFAASTLFISSLPLGANGQVVQTTSTATEVVQTTNTTVEQVSKAKAKKMSGTYKFKYNTNVRANAGTKYKRVTLAKAGKTAKATHKKKVGNQTWYKVKVNGKSGWVLNTLVTKQTAKKATAKKKTTTKKATTKSSASKVTKASGKYKLKYNTNVRANAGTKYKILKTAKKGSTFNVTHKKKVGNTTWYKAKISGTTGWVSGSLITKATAKKATAKKKKTTKKTSSAKTSSNVIANAKSHMGKPYVWGARGPNAFDCSGYIQYVFKQSGKSVAGNTTGLYGQASKVNSPKAGDLVFFAGTYRAGISHVGIYLGNGKFIHASTSRGVTIDSVFGPYWKNYFHSYGRL